MKFGEILSELRQDKGLLQKDLAALINVSVSTVSNYETSAHFPDVETLIKLASYFNVSVDYLLGRTTLREDFIKLNENLAENLTVSDLVNKILSYNEDNRKSLLDYISLLDLRK